jgi:hypothetical protein
MLLSPGCQQSILRLLGNRILNAFAGLFGTGLETFSGVFGRNLGFVANIFGARLRGVADFLSRMRFHTTCQACRDVSHRLKSRQLHKAGIGNSHFLSCHLTPFLNGHTFLPETCNSDCSRWTHTIESGSVPLESSYVLQDRCRLE